MDKIVELLATLADNGVRLSAEGDQLNCYAPKGALTQVHKAAIQLHKPELLSLLKTRQSDVMPDTFTAARDFSGRDFPMTVGAQALYILQELEPDSSAFNVPLCMNLIGAIDVPLLEMAWNSVLNQHPVLMARVVESHGVPILRMDESCRANLRCEQLDLENDSKFLTNVRAHARQPFDLRRGPLVRIELFRRDETHATLLVTAHHIIFDGTSGVVLLKTLLGNYRRMLAGSFKQTNDVSFGYADFSMRERDLLTSPDGVSHARYWQKRLAGIPPRFQLLPDARPGESYRRDEGSTFTEELGDDLSESLRAIAVASGMTLSSVLLAVFVLLLRRYSGEKDIVVGMPVSLRSQELHATDLGYFVNMVPLRIECRDDCLFLQYLRSVQYTMVDALYHSSYPIDGFVDIPFGLKSRNPREARHGRNAIFQVSYAYQDFLRPDEFSRHPDEPGPETEYIDSIAQEGESDLSLQVFNNGSQVVLQFSYDSSAYSRDTAIRFFAHYRQMLQAVAGNPNRSNGEFDYLTSQERQRVLIDFNCARMDHPNDAARIDPKNQCIHALFEEQVRRTPEATALACGDQRVSYAELNARANRLAHHL
ncbi:MAG: condensation domain-containing protein, partial [Lysobacteraceae bacterium]